MNFSTKADTVFYLRKITLTLLKRPARDIIYLPGPVRLLFCVVVVDKIVGVWVSVHHTQI